MASIACIPFMKARTLTIMATRSQDQDLVSSIASDLEVRSRAALDPASGPACNLEPAQKVVPAFGWHPWFSYQLYDDTGSDVSFEATFDPTASDVIAQKRRHYRAVLSPAPADDDDDAFLASLPHPKPLSEFLAETRTRLAAHETALIGEVGLDKAFRLPQAWHENEGDGREKTEDGITPGGREGRPLSPHHVRMEHQIRILRAQLRLAGQEGRAVSVHGVQAHGMLYDVLSWLWKGHEKEVVSKRQLKRVAPGAEDFSSDDEDEDGQAGHAHAGRDDKSECSGQRRKVTSEPKPFPPRICLHSFSGSAQMLKQYLNPRIPARIYFSFSAAINLLTANGAGKLSEILRACPDDQVLVESDLHSAGEDMDALLEQMYRKICDIKGWGLREGVERIRRNYDEFVFG